MPQPVRPPPWLPANAADAAYDDAFRNNVRAFLQAHGTPVPLPHAGLDGVRAWAVRLVWPPGGAPPGGAPPPVLQVYEEALAGDEPRPCWQHHPVCNSTFHFVVPGSQGPPTSAADAVAAADLPALVEAVVRARPPGRGTAAGAASTATRAAWLDSLHSPSHALHGALHRNGFGHLLRVNGREGGATTMTGGQAVALWDRLCRTLRARVVSVEDVSNKGGMELRVLYTAARRQTWYGRWGYTFGRGAYGTPRSAWRAAAAAVHGARFRAVADELAAAGRAGDVCAADAAHVLARFAAAAQGAGGVSAKEGTQAGAPQVADYDLTLGAVLDAALGLLSTPDAARAALAKPAPSVKGGGAAGGVAGCLAGDATRAPPRGSVPQKVEPCCSGVSLPQLPGASQHVLPPVAALLAPLDRAATLPARCPPAAAGRAMAAIVSFLADAGGGKGAVGGAWVPRSALRAAAAAAAGDVSVADAVLRVVGNAQVAPGVGVYREAHPVSKVLHFLLHAPGGPPAVAAAVASLDGGGNVADRGGSVGGGVRSSVQRLLLSAVLPQSAAAIPAPQLQPPQPPPPSPPSSRLRRPPQPTPASLADGCLARCARSTRAASGPGSAPLSPGPVPHTGSGRKRKAGASSGRDGRPSDGVAVQAEPGAPGRLPPSPLPTSPPGPPPPAAPPLRGLARELAQLCASGAAEMLPAGVRRSRAPPDAYTPAPRARPRAAGAPGSAGGAAAPTPPRSGVVADPPPPWAALAPGAALPASGDPPPAHQVLRDLLCVFDAALRPPLGARVVAGHGGMPAPPCRGPPGGALAGLAAAAAVLRDTKHFIKDYAGHLPRRPRAGGDGGSSGGVGEGKSGGGRGSTTAVTAGRERVLISLSLASPLPPVGAAAAAAAAGRKLPGGASRAGATPAPPAEPALLPRGVTAAALRDACRAAFADVYACMKNATVVAAVRREPPATGVAAGQAPVAAKVSRVDGRAAVRHAGGVEDWVVACVCGTRDDDGERMMTCDGCGCWIHTRCLGVADDEPPPAEAWCAACGR